ncbi:unnamed protein product, partial [Linum tenue]
VTRSRCAVVTGANRGLGFAICRQLAASGVVVVLTARDENRGIQAVDDLKSNHGVSPDNIVYHQLDVTDSSSIASLADFIKTQFGKLDILVGTTPNSTSSVTTPFDYQLIWFWSHSLNGREKINWDEAIINTYDSAVKGLKTNYYAAKEMTQTFLPLLQLSDSPRIVNITSSTGSLQNVKNEWARGVLGDAEHLSEERVEQVLNRFLKDFKDGLLDNKKHRWTAAYSPCYVLSKASLSAYTRIIAKRYPSFCVNCVCPGYVKTQGTFNLGNYTPEEAAGAAVRLALLPDGGPSGRYFSMMEEASF